MHWGAYIKNDIEMSACVIPVEDSLCDLFIEVEICWDTSLA